MFEEQRIRKAIDLIKSRISAHETGFCEKNYSQERIKNIQSDIDDLTILIEFVESKLNHSFRAQMKELMDDLVVVYDDAAVTSIYRFLLFWLVLGCVVLLLTTYQLITL